jgi:hypothetical protein
MFIYGSWQERILLLLVDRLSDQGDLLTDCTFLISQTGLFTFCRPISPAFPFLLPSSPQPSHQFLFA